MTLLLALLPWEFSPVLLLAMGIAAFLYGRGSSMKAVKGWQKICFWCGLSSLYGVLQTHFDYYAQHEFFIGELEQAMLQHVSTFLIALSAPWPALYRGLPKHFRQMITRLNNHKNYHGVTAILYHPVTAALWFDSVLMFWLIPHVHFIAMLDKHLYDLMNASMIVSGLLFWGVAFDKYSSDNTATRIIMLLAVVPAQIAVGLLLSFTPHELYPIYSVCGRALGGITPLQDQQIGGLIVWIHGAMMSIIGVLIVGKRELKNKMP